MEIRSLRRRNARLVSPGRLRGSSIGKSRIGVLTELDFLAQNSRFDHQIANHVEIGLARGQRTIHNAVHRIGQGPAEQSRFLVVIKASDEIGGILAIGLALIEPQTRAGDAGAARPRGGRFRPAPAE